MAPQALLLDGIPAVHCGLIDRMDLLRLVLVVPGTTPPNQRRHNGQEGMLLDRIAPAWSLRFSKSHQYLRCDALVSV